jgi:hypothetical protein
MSPGSSHPSIVIDVQDLVTHADRVAARERHMGNPPRVIGGPDVCYLFHTRDHEVLPGFVDRWHALGIAAQVVVIPLTGGQESCAPSPCSNATLSSRVSMLADTG